MSTPQEYWDMALIKTWRNDGTIGDAVQMFESITNLKLDALEPRLLRSPRGYIPFRMRTRAYVRSFLMDLNDWFWNTPPGQDVELFRKISKSKRDTSKRHVSEGDRDSRRLREQLTKDNARIKMLGAALGFDNRNSSTNWNVTK